AGVDLAHHAEFGSRNVAESLIAQARGSNAALIMMATHGRSGVKRMVLGSVAGEVIEMAAGNVLVVKATAEGEKILERRVHRILLTVDGSPRAEAALPVAVEYARAFGATLELVQAAPF